MEGNKAKAFLFAASIFFLVVSVTAYYKESGLRDVGKLKAAIASVENETETIRLDNRRIETELASLNSSDAYVESIARESLGLVKPGEVVYEFVPGKPAKKR